MMGKDIQKLQELITSLEKVKEEEEKKKEEIEKDRTSDNIINNDTDGNEIISNINSNVNE